MEYLGLDGLPGLPQFDTLFGTINLFVSRIKYWLGPEIYDLSLVSIGILTGIMLKKSLNK